jgi:hypothetical protein
MAKRGANRLDSYWPEGGHTPTFPTPPFFTRPPPQLTRPPFLGGEGEKPVKKPVTGHFFPQLPDLPDLSLIPEGGKKKRDGREGEQMGHKGA